MIVEAPVAGRRLGVDGAVVDERLYCAAVFCFAVLHEVFDDDVFPELFARDALLLLDGVGDDGCERAGFVRPGCSPIVDDASEKWEVLDGLRERVVLVRVEHDVVHQAEGVDVS